MKHLKQHFPLPGLLVAGVSGLLTWLVFLPVLSGTYGIYDAVRMAHDLGWSGESRLIRVILGGGRFLYAGLADIGFAQTPLIEDLWALRAIGVLGLSLAAGAISAHAFRMGWKPVAAVTLGILAVANPGTATFGFWSACFPFGFAVLMAFYAGCLWERPDRMSRSGSVVLLQLSFMIYQPAALFFLAGPFIRWFSPSGETGRPFRAFWSLTGLGFGMVLHLVLVRVGLQIFPEAIQQQERLISGDIVASLRHVALSVFPRLLTSWGGILPGPWAPLFGVVGLIGLVVFLAGSRGYGDRLLRLLACAGLGVTLVPAILSADHYTPYRLLAPAYCMAWFMAFAGVYHCLPRYPVGRKLIATGLCVVFAGFTAFVVRYGVVQPRVEEYAILKGTLVELSPGHPPAGILVIRPEGTAPIDRHIRQQGEYGAYELTFGGFSEAYLSLIAAEVYQWQPGIDYPLNRIHWIFYPSSVEKLPVFYPVLDLRLRLQGKTVASPAIDEGSVARHPYLGDSLFFEPNLYLSTESGLIQQSTDGWFFMPGRGWLQWVSEPGEDPVLVRDTAGQIRAFPIPSGE